jgi:hypothetical protein
MVGANVQDANLTQVCLIQAYVIGLADKKDHVLRIAIDPWAQFRHLSHLVRGRHVFLDRRLVSQPPPYPLSPPLHCCVRCRIASPTKVFLVGWGQNPPPPPPGIMYSIQTVTSPPQANLTSARLATADLSGASLSNATLSNAKMALANLQGATLRVRSSICCTIRCQTFINRATRGHLKFSSKVFTSCFLARIFGYYE